METKKLTCWDLMIGDNVKIKEPNKYAGVIGSIRSLSSSEGAYFAIYINDPKFGTLVTEVFCEDIEPIPLTTEILEKNGFELFNQDFTSRKVYKFGCFDYIECNDYHENNRYNYFSIGCYREYKHFGTLQRYIHDVMKIKYVHELQHALRLCGINDKEIVL